jgi:hypothetical protein
MNEDSEQLPDADDAIIGHAFRWSLAAIIPIAILIGIGFWYVNRKPIIEEVVVPKNTEDIRSLDTNKPEIPTFQFTDITTESGIDFLHNNGANGNKLLPETMGGGVAVIDYDMDGLPDLFFVDSGNWPEDSVQPPGSRLYRNTGGNHFQDVSLTAGIKGTVNGYGMGCAVGDYDNDGDPDLFVATLGKNQLLRNNAGTFEDVTKISGVAGAADAWSTSCGFFDFDRDGDLDLFVCNYVAWTRETDFELNFSLNGTDRAYGPPTNYRGAFSYLYRNNGKGKFEEIANDAGLHVVNPDSNTPVSKSLAVVFIDADQDGFDDILIANDTVQNQLFHNQGDGTFQDIGSISGMAFDRDGQSTGAMGIDIGFPYQTRRMAIGIGNFANEMTSLYVQQDAPLVYVDESLAEGVGAPSRARLTFGLLFADLDLDGRVDLLQTNGHLEKEINEVQPSQTYLQPAQLFWNQGEESGRCFAVVPKDKSGALRKPIAGRGATYADLDQDGDLDLVLTQTGSSPVVLRNDRDNTNHWLRIHLTGTKSNRDALGSELEVQYGDKRRFAVVSPTRSYLSQTERIVTFGLGDAQQVDKLIIKWPSGVITEQTDIHANQLLQLTEPDSR